MREEKETKKLLIESAKSEFMEKGFEKASLRTICKNAGVTTGALYFLFDNKEDLFSAVVGGLYNSLMKMLSEHYNEHEVIFNSLNVISDVEEVCESNEHMDIEFQLIHLLYEHYDECRLLLEKSQGTKYEHCVDTIVDMTEKSYIFMAQKIAKLKPNCRVNEYMCHWLTHITINAFIHLLTHIPDEKTALECLKKMMNFLLNGWIDLVLIED